MLPAALGAIIGVLVGLSVPWVASNISVVEDDDSGTPTVLESTEWDPGSLRYLGSLRAADIWLATRNAGASTCMVIQDASGLLPSTRTCTPTSRAQESGVGMGIWARIGGAFPSDLRILREFAVVFVDGEPTLSISERITAGDDATAP